MSLPVLKHTLLSAFEPGAALQPVESFRAFGRDYIGVQSLFPADEEAWDNGDPVSGATTGPDRGFGRWHGPAPLHSNVLVSIVGADYELAGHDDVAHVSGTMIATALIGSRSSIKNSVNVRFVLQDAADGGVLKNQVVAAPHETCALDLGSLTVGQSAILWVRVEDALPAWSLPPDYYSLAPYADYRSIPADYKYVVDGTEYVWDWLRDVGLRPADSQQLSLNGIDMYAKHQELVLSQGLQDRGEWTTYVRSAATQNGEWSALRIVEGAGEWTVGELTAYPGAALFKINGASREAVNFDPLARSVSAFDYDGSDIVLAGSIASRSGALLALWRMASDESATLLGTHPNITPHICEMALLSNFASDTQLTSEGQRQVLSLGGLHYYDESKPIPGALPGVPRETEGHPGGRCLREHPSSKQVLFLTENFSGPPNFYNRLQEQTAGRRATGPGTVFHGHNCADNAWGQYYGIHQDKPFSAEDARQYIAYLKDGAWVDGGIASFPAAAYRWQRVRSIATAEGLKLLVSGKNAVGEGARWGLTTGMSGGFKESSLSFRPRRLTRIVANDGNEQIYAVGRFADEGEVDAFWSVISITGNYVKVCLFFDLEGGYFEVLKSTLTDAGFDLAKLPPYLWWETDTDQDAGGVWLQRDEAPEDERPYLALSQNSTSVRYTPDDGLPYDGDVWGRICFTLNDDGSTGTDEVPPETDCDSADCVEPKMPEGTKPLFLSKNLTSVWSAAQVSDLSDIDEESRMRRLHLQTLSWPLLWWRVDSDAPVEDLTTYKHRLKFNRFQNLPKEARERIDVCVLVPPDIGEIRVPSLDKWN